MYIFYPLPSHKKTWGIILVVIGVILLLFAVLNDVLCLTDDSDEPFHYMEETARDELEDFETYYISQMAIFDYYCVETSDDEEYYYCLGAFYDKNDALCVAPIKIDKYDSIFDDAMAYFEGDEFGNYVTPVYVTVNPSPDSESLQRMQKDNIDFYVENDLFEEADVLDVMLEPTYEHTQTAEEVVEEQHETDIIMTILLNVGSVVIGLIGILLIRSGRQKETQQVGYEDRFTTRW